MTTPYTGNGGSASADSLTIIPAGNGDADTKSRPDYKRDEYKAGQAARQLCEDLMLGSTAVKARGKTYLPKWPAEKEDKYAIRAGIAHVTGYYQRTVQASVGMICKEPPELSDDADPLIKADWEDVDGKGTHGEVFAKTLATEAINGGFVGILVDAPQIPEGMGLTLADEQALGLRPFWVTVPAERIISWVVDVPDWVALLRDYMAGILIAEQVKSYARQAIVRQVVIYEPTDVKSGTFGVDCKDRYRVLSLEDTGVTFVVWEKRNGQGSTGEHFAMINSGKMLQSGHKPFREIPLAIIYSHPPKAPFVCDPALLAQAELNIDHYQVTSDRRYLMRLCHAPTLFLAGFDQEVDETGRKKEINVGPNSVLVSKNAEAKATYVAADPQALDSSKAEKDDLVDQMAAIGMSFLARGKQSGTETATAAQLDDAAENSTHATVGRGLQDGMEQALKFHAMYRGVPAPEIKINTTYASPHVDPQIAAVLWSAVAADRLDMDSFVTYIATGELPDDVALRLSSLKLLAAQMADTEDAADAAGKGKPDVTPIANKKGAAPPAEEGDPAEPVKEAA